jgi:hypothetical protein
LVAFPTFLADLSPRSLDQKTKMQDFFDALATPTEYTPTIQQRYTLGPGAQQDR